MAGETLNSCPAHPASPPPSVVPFAAQRGTTDSSHVFNNLGSRLLPEQPSTLWHSKTAYKNHPLWARKSPDLELTTHQGWQTIQEADDGSLPIPLTKVTQQPPGTQQEMKSLWQAAPSLFSASTAAGTSYFHLKLLISLISQIVMYLNDSWLLLESHLQAGKPPDRPTKVMG